MNKERLGTKTKVAGHTCLGYYSWTDYGKEFDCEYEPDFTCDECVFAVGYDTNDYRKGKKPWARRNQSLQQSIEENDGRSYH